MIGIGSLISLGNSLFHRGTSSSEKQAAVQADLDAALRGDLQAAHTILFAQQENHTRETRGYYKQAESVLRARRPDVVAQVLGTAPPTPAAPAARPGLPSTIHFTPPSMAPSNPLQNALDEIKDSIQEGLNGVRETVAGEVLQLGAGGSAQAAAAIAPDESSLSHAVAIPTDTHTLALVGVALLLVVLLLRGD